MWDLPQGSILPERRRSVPTSIIFALDLTVVVPAASRRATSTSHDFGVRHDHDSHRQ
jgi:hypothetical protein